MPDTVKADLPDGSNYVLESLKHEIKYCELERLWFKSGWRYYANVYFDGDAPKKLQPGRGTMGIDEGPSTAAALFLKTWLSLRNLHQNARTTISRLPDCSAR